MSDPWLSIIGLGEDGLSGLSDASRSALDKADLIFGGPRHLDLVNAGDRGQPWPVPFSIDPVLQSRGKQVSVLASGDPFWHGAGGSLASHLQPGEWASYPVPSTFALVANHMAWRIEDTLCLGLHAAPFERLLPILAPNTQLICTLRDGAAPAELAAWLTQQGFGETQMAVMELLGGPNQRVRSARADAFDLSDVQAPVAVALAAMGNPGLPRASGLPDDVFHHDGQITKRPIRALTLSALAPRPGQLLWDIGGGSGSISVEWCLAAPGARALIFEQRTQRSENINRNAAKFGLTHRMSLVIGQAPQSLETQELPATVFIGGGASQALLDQLWQILPPGTRIIANGVTLETETLLMTAHAQHGGHLMKAEIAEAGPLGSMRGWERARPVLQWSVTR
ncbi:cobalamin biosynthesis bifunctional protein CbiET [Sedimentitalea sp. CY04]|uniref:Cobalamin biosynthesis bifunctional protein CbiET n=1 Tax=Parasedimentitalea denitrificans TaxID=2211118 RepID=A0ABX0W4F5_9RHOB|nr:precorrin-6y C5,15-methyltransferase (decarboxylating) subunit CbiE [Sedimentitalea sp. CY04]NIZ59689.1 cobalamin biosynthesis bifunctional protein CbiET [Sedimentitalea sp. CY04]